MKNQIKDQIFDSSKVKQAMVAACTDEIMKAAKLIISAYKKGKKVLICGNGGSAGDAQHVTGELVNKFRFDRAPLAAIALTCDTSIITAVGNDSSFSDIFKKQVEALGEKGDVLIVITTSDVEFKVGGHSSNIAFALKSAKSKGLKTIGLVSIKSKRILKYLDLAIKIPSKDTPRIQEGHLLAEHIICDLVEQGLFKAKTKAKK